MVSTLTFKGKGLSSEVESTTKYENKAHTLSTEALQLGELQLGESDEDESQLEAPERPVNRGTQDG